MLALARWLSRRSLATLHALGTLVGWLGYALSGTYRRRLDENAALAGLTGLQRRQAVAEAGRMVTELPWLWLRAQDSPLGGVVAWRGEAPIDEAIAQGRGIVFVTPHLGSFEVSAQAFAERYGRRMPMTVMYRPARQAWLRELEKDARMRPGLATVPTALAGVRQMIRALRRGEAVGLLPDQVPPAGQGVWAPFFGRPAYTMTLAARLVQQTGATLVLAWAERLPQGAGYVVRVSLPQQPLPTEADDDVALQLAWATAINREMEQLIRQAPGQYLWGYNRYKPPRPLDALTGEEGRSP